MYAAGGETYQRVGVVERYSVAKKKWKFIEDMRNPHAAHCSTGMDPNKVYIFYGLSSIGNTNVIEVYDRRVGSWKEAIVRGETDYLLATNCLGCIGM